MTLNRDSPNGKQSNRLVEGLSTNVDVSSITCSVIVVRCCVVLRASGYCLFFNKCNSMDYACYEY